MAASSPLQPPFPGDPTVDRGPGLRIGLICLMVFASLAVVLRFTSRSLQAPDNRGTRRFWWDDWVVLVSLPTVIAAGTLVIDMIRLGFGRHIWVLSHASLYAIAQRMFVTYYLCDTGLALAKASCLLFYTRMFSHGQPHRGFQRAIWASHILNCSVLTGQLFYITLNFTPAQQMKGNLESDIRKYWFSSAIPSVLVDLVLVVLPLPMLWKLKIDLKRKVGVIAIFIFSYGTIVVSLGRLISIHQAKDMARDVTYDSIGPMYWRAAEISTTIICVCLPAMLSLGKWIFGHVEPSVSKVSTYICRGKLFKSKGPEKVTEGCTPNDAYTPSSPEKTSSMEKMVV